MYVATVAVLRQAAPFVDRLPRQLHERIVGGLGLPDELGATPVGEFVASERRARLATRLAAVVVDEFPSTPLGSLLPPLRTLEERRISMLSLDGRVRAILRRERHLQSWEELAEQAVAGLREIRNLGPAAARAIVAACVDRAVTATLPAFPRTDCSLARGLDELRAVLDDRTWLVLAARQVSHRDRATAAALARLLGISRNRVRQLEKQAELELREALGDPHFIEVAAAVWRIRETLGNGPVSVSDARDAAGTANGEPAARLGEEHLQLLLWCAGPYDLVDDTLVLRDTPPS